MTSEFEFDSDVGIATLHPISWILHLKIWVKLRESNEEFVI